MARWFSFKPSLSFKGRKFKGIRGFSGKPFHPPLTDIPVTAYFLLAIFDLISYIAFKMGHVEVAQDFYVSATNVVLAGAIVSVPTILTGFWDWLKSTPNHTQVWRTANAHMAIMLTTSMLVAANLVLRLAYYGADLKYPDLLILILSVLIGGLVSWGAAYGGAMVYEYGFNVEQDFDHAYTESEVDHLPGQEEEKSS
ncbi:MAG: putative rane protein [Actinomycetota bacterium]|nr:putative rane protein [Actinomycetota bacterium]